MNSFTRWCHRIGLISGLLAVLSGYAVIPFELGAPLPESFRKIAEQTFSIFAPIFMGLGIVLLIAAIVWLRTTWPQLSKATKVVSVLGLLTSTFAGAYVFHWLFPGILNERHRT
jgi:hypothetical protein